MNNLRITLARISQDIDIFEAMKSCRSDLNLKISRLRNELSEAEDNLAKKLAKYEFRRQVMGISTTRLSDDELNDIFEQHLGSMLDELNVHKKTLKHLDADINELKLLIERDLAKAKEESAAAVTESN